MGNFMTYQLAVYGQLLVLSIPICLGEYLLAKKYGEMVALALPIIVLSKTLELGIHAAILSGVLFLIYHFAHPKT